MRIAYLALLLVSFLVTEVRAGECQSDSLSSCMEDFRAAAKDIVANQSRHEVLERVETAGKALHDCLNCASDQFSDMMQNFGSSLQIYNQQRQSRGRASGGMAPRPSYGSSTGIINR